MKRFLLSLAMAIAFLGTSYGQTTLSVGDIAIIGIGGDNPDDFHFILLVDIESGTEITFTDSGWLSSGSFRGNEGAQKYTAPSAQSAGTVISFITNSGNFTNANDSNVGTNGVALSSSGDQILAFQGASSSPTFIFAAQTNSNVWQSDATASTNSALPSGLTDGVTAVAVGAGSGAGDEFDNAWYSGSTSGNSTELLALIADNSNWTGNNSSFTPQTSFTLSSVDVSISGGAGWRLLSLPIRNGLVTDVSDDSPVQGVTGGDDTGSDANFIIYDSDATFEQPTNVTTAWGDGLGFGLYFYNNTTNGSSTLPVTLDATGVEPLSDVDVNLNPAASGYTLVGNPFESNYDASSITATSSNISNNIAFWNNGSGSYSTQDRTTPYIVAPWQGFWVQTVSAAATTLSFPTSGKTTSSTTGTFFSKTGG